MEEAADRLFLLVDEQGSLPAKVDALAAQAAQVYAVFLKGDVEGRHLLHELGKTAVRIRSPHLHHPDIVLSVGAQLSIRVLALFSERQTR